MKVAVTSVLFGRLNQTDAKVLLKMHKGQHHLLRDTDAGLRAFSDGVPEVATSGGLGGWDRSLPIEPVDGAAPIAAATLTYHYTGPGSEREEAYFARQTAHPYPLWDPARARPGATDPAELEGDVVLVVRDTDGRFHARYVRREDLAALPDGLRTAIAQSNGKGVYTVPPAAPTATPTGLVAEIIEALRRHHNVLLYGPPGTGKTHLVSEVRRHFGDGAAITLDTEAEAGAVTESSGGGGHLRHAWATFHQSYSYEDFLVGLRPVPGDGGTGFTLEPRPGLLLELAEWARQDGRESLLVIDEINRGNVSRIFGEFITLMEPDKRLDDAGVETDQTVSVRLPFVDLGQDVTVQFSDDPTDTAQVPAPFTMPLRVFTLATMNSVDKSVAPLDAALRRRFHVIDLSPRMDQFRTDHLGLPDRAPTSSDIPSHPTTRDEVCWTAVGLLEVLNQRITLFLGPDFQLGEWFLADLVAAASDADARTALAEVWRSKLMPQLEDYFVGRSEQLRLVLGTPDEAEPALMVASPQPAYEELGAVPALRARPGATDDELLTFMAGIARADLPSPPSAPDAVS